MQTKMPEKLILPRRRLQIVMMALVAAANHSTNALAEYQIWKQFLEQYPREQVFLISTKEKQKEWAD